LACAACPTKIYTNNDHRPGIVNLRAGTLDDSPALTPGLHLWTQSKQAWVVIHDDVPSPATQPEMLEEWMGLLMG